MRLTGLTVLVTTVLFSAIGCGSSTTIGGNASHGGVAVVDLDAVAKRVGRSEQMNQDVRAKEALINKELADLQASYRQQIQQKKDEFGPEPSEEQASQLVAMERQVTIQLTQAQRNGQRELTRHQATVIQRFREELKPMLRNIASEQGLSIVVPKDERLLLTYEPAVEITESVVEKLLAQRPIAPPVAPTAQATPSKQSAN